VIARRIIWKDWAIAMATETNHDRDFLSYSGVKLPLNLVSPIAETELQNRNTYFRAVFDDAGRLLSCEKIVYGEVELSHFYEYSAGGRLLRAKIAMGDDEATEIVFNEDGLPTPINS
jgi:hypothetical protein